jgi:hypothetical protein
LNIIEGITLMTIQNHRTDLYETWIIYRDDVKEELMSCEDKQDAIKWHNRFCMHEIHHAQEQAKLMHEIGQRFEVQRAVTEMLLTKKLQDYELLNDQPSREG